MNTLWRRAEGLANLIDGHPMAVGKSAEQIYQTMLARPGWNRQKWITAVEMAARELIASGYTNLPWSGELTGFTRKKSSI